MNHQTDSQPNPHRRGLKIANTINAVIIAVLLALLAVPALGDHVTEPTSPITEYVMEVYVYPNFSTALTACDGTEVLLDKFGNVATDARFETFVDYPARATGSPSEHWDETLTLFIVENFGTNRPTEHYQWRVSWKHSNVGPHQSGGVGGNGPEVSQNTQLLTGFAPGTILRIRGQLDTRVSGASNQVLTAECTFKIAGGEAASSEPIRTR